LINSISSNIKHYNTQSILKLSKLIYCQQMSSYCWFGWTEIQIVFIIISYISGVSYKLGFSMPYMLKKQSSFHVLNFVNCFLLLRFNILLSPVITGEACLNSGSNFIMNWTIISHCIPLGHPESLIVSLLEIQRLRDRELTACFLTK
jgi:hypothetical protein